MDKQGKFCILGMTSILILISLLYNGCTDKKPEQKEFRGVWLHQPLFSANEDTAKRQITALFDAYAGLGINNLFCYYTLHDENNLSWDYLQVLITEGHRRGLRIHPIFCPGHEVNLEKALSENPDWLIHDMEGKVCPNYNLALPEVRKYWVNRIARALKYDIDGIHLDYIRFPVNQRFSYDSVTCDLFKRECGYSPLEVSHDGGSMIWCEWIRWNEKQVTSLVSEIHGLIKDSGKQNILLGADVFPNAGISQVEIAQNWQDWAQKGIIDFVCPMLYTNNVDLFRNYLSDAVVKADSKCDVYAGIGVVTSHNKITKELLADEIRIAREAGARGVVFFSGNSFSEEFREAIRPVLTSGE
jgi:uncharacterized lipoprotein YddW (UPF0748 family)